MIKDKWSDYRSYSSKSSTKLRKNLSLFISLRGDYVAVASANQITILSKENDYQQPHGTFTCKTYNFNFTSLDIKIMQLISTKIYLFIIFWIFDSWWWWCVHERGVVGISWCFRSSRC